MLSALAKLQGFLIEKNPIFKKKKNAVSLPSAVISWLSK
jgi:hypothetical protein